MAITPDEIENRVFPLVRRGYEPAEVDSFLKEVASALAQAQGGLATPPSAAPPDAVAEPVVEPPAPPAAVEIAGPDDFGRLGDEVASILRQAHESVAALRHRAEADAALIREVAHRDAAQIRAGAEADRLEADGHLQAVRAEAARVQAELERQRQTAAAIATATAQAQAQQVVDAARADARGAVEVQRNVRDRLTGTRDDIDVALGRLAQEDEDLFDAIDLTDAAMEAQRQAEARYPLPGEGPPSPAVAPPPRPPAMDMGDLPYATDDDELGGSTGSEPVLDLTEEPEAEVAPTEDPLAEPPVAEADDVTGTGTEAGDGASEEPAPAAADDDPLAQMVKNAVENALRRRKGTDPGTDQG